MDLDWEFADFSVQYTDDVVVRGVLTGGDNLDVMAVSDVDGGSSVSVTSAVQRGSGTSLDVEKKVDEPALPIDELPGEDLYGLRAHLRTPGVEPIYLGSNDFVDRVRQLRANCERLECHTRDAVAGLGQTIDVRKVTDVGAIADAGVMRTPALGIDATLLFQGRVPPVDELMTLLADVLSREGQAG